jgi:hypothetical protein
MLNRIRALPFVVRLAIVALAPAVIAGAYALAVGKGAFTCLAATGVGFAIGFVGLNIGRKFGVQDEGDGR